MSSFFAIAAIAFAVMATIMISATLFILLAKKRINKRPPAASCAKFSCRKKFEKHGQDEFDDEEKK